MNHIIYKWRYFCENEQKWLYCWTYERPTQCIDCNRTIDQEKLNKEGVCNKVIYLFPNHSPFKLGTENFYICNTSSGDIFFILNTFDKDRIVFIKKSGNINSVIIKSSNNELIDQTTMKVLQSNNKTLKLKLIDGNWLSIDLSSTDGELLIDGDIRNNDYQKNDIIIYDGTTHRALKNNLDANTNPSPDDDSSKNYMPGSGWINSLTNEHFILLNSTMGAALWKKTTGISNSIYCQNNQLTRSTINVFKTHLKLETGNLEQKEYFILWYFEIYNEHRYGDFDARILLNGDVVGDVKDKDSFDDKRSYCGFVLKELVGYNLIEIQYKNNNINGNLIIKTVDCFYNFEYFLIKIITDYISDSYSLSSNFSGNLNLAQLHEIIESNNSITTTLIGVSNTGDNVDIIFQSPLSGAEQTALTTIVSDYIRADKAIIGFETTGSDNTTAKITIAQTANRILTIPDTTDTFVLKDLSQTLTNKTLDANSNTISSITNMNISSSAGIDATKIADGTVNNTTFQYIGGTTSNIQTQINNHTGNYNNPHNVTKAQLGLSNVQNIKNNTSVSDPTINDDSGDGYSVGSNWINTSNNLIFVCVDSAVGAAIWIRTTVPTVSNVGTAGVGIFKEFSSNDFKFKNINAGSAKITITNDTGNDEIDIDISPNQIDINSLSNAPTGTVVGTTDVQTLTNKTVGDSLNLSTNKIINLGAPTSDNDASTKIYVDTINTSIQTALNTKLNQSPPIIVSSAVQTSTTSSAYILIPSMTSTPSAGKYFVSFSGSIRATTTTQTITIAIYLNGTVVNDSVRTFHNMNSFLNGIQTTYSVHAQTSVTVNGTEAVDVRIKTTGGASADILNRNFMLIRTE